jgi:hypothetical protein
MNVIVMASLCALGIAWYFLRLMADGRRLREGLLDSRTASIPDEDEGQALLITSDYASWMVPPGTPGTK